MINLFEEDGKKHFGVEIGFERLEDYIPDHHIGTCLHIDKLDLNEVSISEVLNALDLALESMLAKVEGA
eukprot:CAMPEP_0170554650 /NCGR_PEP_ID=MMETSP0211-20121228/12529_1 /TAXON_ID=311385 /ORGANISM="Pseudokeronopsis sp., Strain OXSARD2" /LENGTH=68 /DNA_ID=CAMNT_0010863897 /DNA_START=1012 /DNA_END=1218 /DNA_ORIENTATION=+